MKTITIGVKSDNKDDNSATTVTVEEDRGAGQVKVDSKDLTTNKDKDMEFRLRPGQRLVIDAYQPEAQVMNRDQSSAHTQDSLDATQPGKEPEGVATLEQKQEADKRSDPEIAKKGREQDKKLEEAQPSPQRAAPSPTAARPAQAPQQVQSGSANQAQRNAPAAPASASNPLKSSKDK